MRMSLFFVFCFAFVSMIAQDKNCKVTNSAFNLGERVDYTIYYHLAGIWVSAGEVYFKVDSARFGENQYYHFNSYGRTFKKYDWIYKVRDHYESYVHAQSFKPLRFKRSVNEGSTYIREDYLFDHRKDKIYTVRQMKEDAEMVKDTIDYGGCSYDVVSMIYYARNIDFSYAKKNEKIPIRLLLDNKVHETYVRYLGKEELKVKGLGKFNCVTFSPFLIEGTIFNAGEDMKVYVTDDRNRIPLLIETPILVGSIRARVSKLVNIRYPLDSKIE